MRNNRVSIFIILFIVLSGCSSIGSNKPKWFEGKRIEHSISLEFSYSPDEIFPLLCPVREYEWMASWKGTIVFTNSGFAEKYVVFYHDVPIPFQNKKAYWIAGEYVPNKTIQWIVTVPGIAVIVIDENFVRIENNRTRIDYHYTVTGVSSFGNFVIEKKFSRQELLKEMKRTRDEIHYYLETGEMLQDKYESKMFK